MTIHLTHFDLTTRQPVAASQPLPCATLDDAVAVMGPPLKRYQAMAIYDGFCLSRAVISIDGPDNSGHTVADSNQNGSTDQ